MVENDDDVLKELPDEAIELTFPCDGMEIAVLNNELFNNNVEDNATVLCKIIVDEEGNTILESLSTEEAELAYKKYEELIELFGGEN